MRHRVFLIYLLGVLMGTAMLTSCQDDWSGDEHYQVPEWLKGNAYEAGLLECLGPFFRKLSTILRRKNVAMKGK